MNWFKEWKQRKKEAEDIAGQKQDIYKRGDEIYYLEPTQQRVLKLTVKSVIQDQHGIHYTGEWDGIIKSKFWRHDQTVSHKEVHHDKYALLVQFVDNFPVFEYC